MEIKVTIEADYGKQKIHITNPTQPTKSEAALEELGVLGWGFRADAFDLTDVALTVDRLVTQAAEDFQRQMRIRHSNERAAALAKNHDKLGQLVKDDRVDEARAAMTVLTMFGLVDDNIATDLVPHPDTDKADELDHPANPAAI